MLSSIGKFVMVAASHIHLFRDRGDRMATGSANQSPLPEVVVLFMFKEGRFPLQVGQVIHVLFVRILAWRYFRDEGGQFTYFRIFCHARQIR
jgi:hypothetical protein